MGTRADTKATKTRWLDRTLVLGPYLCLCLSEAEYMAAAKHCGWRDARKDTWCLPESGRVHYDFDGPKPVAVVCVNYVDASEVAVAGILVHEAMHIWQGWLRSMGEDSPGDEVSAYAVQNLVVLLMDEWARRTRSE